MRPVVRIQEIKSIGYSVDVEGLCVEASSAGRWWSFLSVLISTLNCVFIIIVICAGRDRFSGLHGAHVAEM